MSNKRGIGRPRDPVWDNFTEVNNDDSKYTSARCNYCGETVHIAQKLRLGRHLYDCDFVPGKEFKLHAIPPLSKRNTPLQNNALIGSEEIKETIEEVSQSSLEFYFALMIYSTGIPFRVVEDPFFKMFFQLACPNFHLPTRQKLSGSMLDDVFNRCKLKVIQGLRDEEHLTLVSDGWADNRNRHIVNFVLASPRMSCPVFWSLLDTSSATNDGEFVAQYLDKTIQEVERDVGIQNQICAVVTDNASVMKKSWDILGKTRKNIVFNGCAAHWLNLIMGDVLEFPTVHHILTQSTKLPSYVRNSYYLLGSFRKIQNSYQSTGKFSALSLPVATRWYSSCRCIINIVSNCFALQSIFKTAKEFPKFKTNARFNEMYKIVFDGNFWEEAEAIVKLLEPIDKSLGKCEEDMTAISMVYYEFSNLLKHEIYTQQLFEINHKNCEKFCNLQLDIVGVIAKRRNKFLTASIKVACFMDQRIDPSIMQNDNGESEIEGVIEDAISLASRDIVDINTKEQFEAVFQRDLEQWHYTRVIQKHYEHKTYRNRSPYDYWFINNKFPNLQLFGKKLFAISSSSASSERSWSVHEFIHSKRRNRLQPDKVRKLVFVYSNLKTFLIGKKLLNDNLYSLLNPELDDQEILPTTSEQFAVEQNAFDFDNDADDNGSDVIYPPPPRTPFAVRRSPRFERTGSSSNITSRSQSPLIRLHSETQSTDGNLSITPKVVRKVFKSPNK